MLFRIKLEANLFWHVMVAVTEERVAKISSWCSVFWISEKKKKKKKKKQNIKIGTQPHKDRFRKKHSSLILTKKKNKKKNSIYIFFFIY